MSTQKFMGRGKLLERLTSQVGDEGLAIAILKKRGHLKSDGKTYTQAGIARNAMTAEERAKDRASQKTGVSVKEFKYNPATNTAKRK